MRREILAGLESITRVPAVTGSAMVRSGEFGLGDLTVTSKTLPGVAFRNASQNTAMPV